MSTARTFVRLAITGFIVNVLAIACVVSDNGDGEATCGPGEYDSCTCQDGSKSTRQCKASGSGWLACECGPGSSGGGGANSGGEGNASTAGSTNTSYAGETSSVGGAPGEAVGGAPAEAGGAGGAPGEDPLPVECQDASDNCEICYFEGCCTQWAPCVNDDTCLAEFNDIIQCTEGIKATRNVTTADLEACAEDAGQPNGSWSTGVSELTADMVNCVAGEPGWEGKVWGSLACKAECFDQ